MNLNELLRDIRPHVLSWINAPAQGVVTAQGDYNVLGYGAVGDDTTNDSPAFQAAVDACTAAGGGTVLVPGGRTYLLATGIVITSINLRSAISFNCYGAILHYTGSGHGLTVLTNCSGFDGTNCYQYAERATRVSGLHMIGTGSAISGIYLFGVVGGSYRDVILDGFTSIVEGSAALKLYGEDIYHWVEQNTFENFEIKHTGNGISLYTYDVDLNWVSLANNYFKDINIWVTVAGGRGIDAHRRKWLLIGRCIFEGVLVHPFNVENVICFDLGEASLDGTIFISPSVDVYGTPLGTVIWHHIDSSVLVIFQPTYWPRANMYNPGITWQGNPLGTTPETYDTSPYTGGGMYSVLGSYGSIRFSEDGFLTIASTTLPAVGGSVDSPALGLYGLSLPAEGDWHSHGMQLKTVVNPDGSHHLDIGDGPVAGETEVVAGAFQIDSAGHLSLVTRTLPAVGAAEDSPTIGLWGLTQPIAGTYVSQVMRMRNNVRPDGSYRLSFSAGPELAQVEVGVLTSDGYFWAKGGLDIGDGALYRNGVAIATGAGSSPIATDPLWLAAGDLAVGSGVGTAYRLPVGAVGQLLSVWAGGWPAWVDPPSVSGLLANSVDGAAIRLANAQWLRARNAGSSADVNIARVYGGDDHIEFGAAIQLLNGVWLRARNAAGTADMNMLRVNASDQIELGAAMRSSTSTAGQTALSIGGYGSISVDYPGVAGGRLLLNDNGDLWMRSNCSALSFTDRTPHYTGDALAELRGVKGDGKGAIDHNSLPTFAQVKGRDGADERDLGGMVSVLTVAVQQLLTRIEELEGKLPAAK